MEAKEEEGHGQQRVLSAAERSDEGWKNVHWAQQQAGY